MSKIIVVIGITGTQGGSVARTFLQDPEWRVRGITRNTSSEAAQKIAVEGAEIVKGDLDDKESLLRAFQGATAIFCNTNYFEHLFQGMADANLATSLGVGGPKEYAYERELAQRLNASEAAEDPSVLATLQRIVVSSPTDTRHWSNGKYAVPFFDAKADAIRLTKERFPGVAARLSTVRLGHNLETWRNFPKMAPQKQPDGKFLLTRQSSHTLKINFLVAEKDTGAFVKAAVHMESGKNLIAVSKYMSFPDYVELWDKTLGVEARYEQVSREQFFEGVPPLVAGLIGDDFDFVEEFGFSGGDDVLYPDQLDVKVPVTDLAEWIRGEDWSSVLNA